MQTGINLIYNNGKLRTKKPKPIIQNVYTNNIKVTQHYSVAKMWR